MAVTITTINIGSAAEDGTGDDARTGGQKINENFAALSALLVDRLVFWVRGDSSDGGTTPDATTQASIDALIAAGIPAANIRWLYEVDSSSGTFSVGEINSGVTVENVVLVQGTGEFTIAEMVSSVTADNITITETAGGGTFVVAEITSGVSADNVKLVPTFPSVSGLKAHFDSSDISTLWTDNGTTQVSSSSDPVYRWDDKSGNGYHLTQATLDNRPTYQTTGIQFDGSNDFIENTTNFGVTAVTPGTYFVVMSSSNQAAPQAPISRASSTSSRYILIQTNNGLPGEARFHVRVGSGVNPSTTFEVLTGTTDVIDSTPHLITARADPATPAHGLWADGVSDATGSTLTSSDSDTDFDRLTIGRLSSSTPGNYFNGYVMEALWYDNAVSDVDRASIESYLKLKWGI